MNINNIVDEAKALMKEYERSGETLTLEQALEVLKISELREIERNLDYMSTHP